MRNHFSTDAIATRYALGRPAFHRHVIDRVAAILGGGLPFGRALDVACGTGGSTVALEGLASRIFAADPSLAMLRQCVRRPRVAYVASYAEKLPFRDGVFDLLTIASAFHWLDRTLFLGEARRVLGSARWLVVYDNYFSGEAVETGAVEPLLAGERT